MTRQIFRLTLVALALWAGLAGCGSDSTSTGSADSATLTVQAQLPSSTAQTLGLAPGTAADVASVTVDVKQDTATLISAQALTKDGTTGVWGGTMANLPLGVTITFIGHAYDNGGEPTQLFTGQVNQVLTGINDQVSIPLAVVDTGVSAVLPRIDAIVSPNAVATSSAVGIVRFDLAGASSETLQYRVTAASGGGSFGGDSGTGVTGSAGQGSLALSGTQGSVTVTYSAPATAGTYVHTLRVTNSQGNYVERQFQIQVCSSGCGNSVTANTAPVVTALGAQRFDSLSGTTVQWTATVVDDGPANALVYQWSFDGGLTFTDPTLNPAVLQNYTTSSYGLIKVTVKDQSGGTGALATTLAYFMPTGQFPATGDQASAGTNGNWKEIAAGSCHALGIRQDGTLWSWGCNTYGQLGLGYASSTDGLVPTQVGTATTWSKVAATYYHGSIALRSDGTVWTWGSNSYGQLGLGDTSDRYQPTQINMFSNNYSGGGANDLGSAIAGGSYHMLVLRADGTLWAFGDNGYGSLGDGTTSQRNWPVRVCAVYSGGCTSPLTGVTAIDTDSDNSAAVVGGKLYAWGNNSYGQLGQTPDSSNHPTPLQVGTATNWVKVGVGDTTNYALNSSGVLYAWGRNNSGQQGTGDAVDSTTLRLVGVPSDVWLSMSVYGGFALAIKSTSDTSATSGTLWSWGGNNYGRLGTGDTYDRATPTQIGGNTNWRTVAAGQYTSFAVQTGNSLWSWGRNADGELGVGTKTDSSVPLEVRQ